MIRNTFRVFVSSTFQDFSEERKILSDVIQPKIDSFCKSKGYNFNLVDLRWGITSETARNQKTIPVCLEEVRRCKSNSPRPSFLVMIGERYGWNPLPYTISESEFMEVYSCISCNEDKELIDFWYTLDTNSVNPEYCLRERRDEYVSEHIWTTNESKLRSILQDAVLAAKLSAEQLSKYFASATEQEIQEGLLSSTSNNENTLVMFKGSQRNETSGYGSGKDENVLRLRKRIMEQLISTDDAERLIKIEQSPSYEEEFVERITSAIINLIEKEIFRISQENESISEAQLHMDYANSLLDKFWGRESELKRIEEHVLSNDQYPFFVFGDAGSGKSSIIAKYINTFPEIDVYFRAYGASQHSYSFFGVLFSIIEDLMVNYNLPIAFIGEETIADVFLNTIRKIPLDKKVVIIIDGYDGFADIQDITENIIPEQLPENIKMFITSNRKDYFEYYLKKSKSITLDKFTKEDCEQILLNYLKLSGRCISNSNQWDRISEAIHDGILPLHVSLLANYVSEWHSYNEEIYLPSTIEEMIARTIENLFTKSGHNKVVTVNTLAYIAASMNGLTEDELQQLLIQDQDVFQSLAEDSYYQVNPGKLPFIIWSRIFFDLKNCLNLFFSGSGLVVKFSHSLFYKVIAQNYNDDYLVAQRKIIDYFLVQPNYVDDNNNVNMRKASILLPLLLSNKEYYKKEIVKLLTDVNFVDASVKNGDLRMIISGIHTSIALLSQSESPYLDLQNILQCLVQNQLYLQCYPGSFIQHYANAGFDVGSMNASYFSIPRVHGKNRKVYFPYGQVGGIFFSDSGKKYAVFANSIIHVHDSVSHVKIMSIRLPSLIMQCVWCGEDMIAFSTAENEVRIVKVNDRLPLNLFACQLECHPLHLIYNVERNTLGVYHQKIHLLPKKKDRIFTVISVTTLEVLYSRRLNVVPSGNVVWTKEGRCFAYGTFYGICLCDSFTGEIVKRIFVNIRIAKKEIFSLNDGIFLLTDLSHEETLFSAARIITSSAMLVYNTDTKRRFFFNHPSAMDVQSILLGKQYLVICYPDNILLVDIIEERISGYCELPNVTLMTWVVLDKEVALLANGRLVYVKIEFFEAISSHFYSKKKNTVDSLNTLIATPKKIVSMLSVFIKDGHRQNGYDAFFSKLQMLGIGSGLPGHTQKEGRPSMIAFSEDGKRAYAYEEFDTIVVYDSNKEALLRLDKLELAVSNSIFKMEFSPNGRYFLVWRCWSLEVIDLYTAKRIIEFDAALCPLLIADFCIDTGELWMVLLDSSIVGFQLKDSEAKIIEGGWEKILEHPIDIPIYSYNPLDEEIAIHPLLRGEDEWQWMEYIYLGEWFDYDRFFFSDKEEFLAFYSGTFFLNGDAKLMFDSKAFNFLQALRTERQMDSTPIRGFLREKNDLTSKFKRYGTVLLLVAKSMNSVIAFDTEQMWVVAAYKHPNNIIGFKFLDDVAVEIFDSEGPKGTRVDLIMALKS